ncbi:hypothetical protein BH23BAC3_BH23BAC3_18540 [soil metagenome]
MIRSLSTFLLILFLLPAAFSLYAQSHTGEYLKVTFFQVEKDDLTEFLDGVDSWKDFHQTKINADERIAWRLYRIPFSSSGSVWYNFVSVEIAANLNTMQSADRNNTTSLKNEKDHQVKLAYSVHSEIWKTEADVFGDNTQPVRYLNANFMYALPQTLQDYLYLETDIAMPIHQTQTDNERMVGWNFYRLIFPTGTAVAYNFITADHYSSLEQIEMGITREVIREVHPDMDVDEFENFADSIRERVWSDLWELIEFTD